MRIPLQLSTCFLFAGAAALTYEDDAINRRIREFVSALPFYPSPPQLLSPSPPPPSPPYPPHPQVLWEIERAEIEWEGSVKLGAGAFGEVVRAKWRGTPVAIKKGAWKWMMMRPSPTSRAGFKRGMKPSGE